MVLFYICKFLKLCTGVSKYFACLISKTHSFLYFVCGFLSMYYKTMCEVWSTGEALATELCFFQS